jgi:tetratricopeptide (TPR) repeat protein
MRGKVFFAVVVLMFIAGTGECQETVFALLRKESKLADNYFEENAFPNALELYLNALKKNPESAELRLKVARCYYLLKDYPNAALWYQKHGDEKQTLSLQDIFFAGEAYAAMGDYEHAIQWYKAYLVKQPDDHLVTKKIWQLSNVHFLYEDSLHYALRPIRSQSASGELCAVPYGNGLVFLSNRKQVQIVEKVDGSSNAGFYRLYYSAIHKDTVDHSGLLIYDKPTLFSKDLNAKGHQGAAAFFNDEKKMAYVTSGEEENDEGRRTLQVYFARKEGGKWKRDGEFPYNSIHYSVSDLTISNDGKILIFSSDMKGGLGGKDLYRSEYSNGKWSKPVNLGEPVNTTYDEVFPYLHNKHTLYFSSNGHAGLGGLDVFKTEIVNQGFSEIVNPGYPLNTNHDEFGIVLDSMGTFGYISSNRKYGGYNDDIYEFDIDLQTYPLVIKGMVKFKDLSWADSSAFKPLPNAKLSLIDNIRNVLVHESYSDAEGHFSLQIPYYSKYKINIIGEDKEENIVSLDIPRHRKLDSEHELVVIKDPFKMHNHNVEK